MTHAKESSVARHGEPWKNPSPWHNPYTTDCTNEKQRLVFSVAVESAATKLAADEVLISLPQGRHNTHPSTHAFAEGVTFPSEKEN